MNAQSAVSYELAHHDRLDNASPYRASAGPAPTAAANPFAPFTYVPLRRLAILASTFIFLGSVANMLTPFAAYKAAKAVDGGASAELFASVCLGITLGMWALGVVFFCLWLHRAASNLPAFGRRGMTFTPAWSVGWFFIPFMSVWKTYQVLSELMRASAPNGTGAQAWRGRPTPPLLPVWCGASWLAAAAQRFEARCDPNAPSASLIWGYVGAWLTLGAASACIHVMAAVMKDQNKSAAEWLAAQSQRSA
jgi:hypothetical protein